MEHVTFYSSIPNVLCLKLTSLIILKEKSETIVCKENRSSLNVQVQQHQQFTHLYVLLPAWCSQQAVKQIQRAAAAGLHILAATDDPFK